MTELSLSSAAVRTESPRLDFSVLGSLTVTRGDGFVLTPTPPKLRLLLAMLILRANQVVSADWLIHGLWGAHPPRTAVTTLQVYISKLRRALIGPDWRTVRGVIDTDTSGYVLRMAGHGCDYLRVRSLGQQARAAEASGDLAEAARLLSESLALWRGPALADVRGGSWLNSQAKALDEELTDLRERWIGLELQLGRHRSLVGELYRLVEEYPNWETLYHHLMIALHRSGRTADALDIYGEMRIRFVDEYGMEPGPVSRRLHQRLLCRDPALNDLSISQFSA
ncbi:AfsR/SARP family transcriptional regulator [Nocardia sp. CDC159]|uniref:AfsR/SARP family transcriptional regulator n=1 Tax=Nocardia pulmonis TaxID=2951408 RepID=A0A9X2E5N1_9NOCA|nr:MULTISPECIES: AfsR/SARP family transcriptional regulator [Nocardia]MCM6774572.1 AfsR/SARP family transcriptional regulator [Nocardia pulmonis]MCM6787363.1 AfsR/SARP family transcriptional regulator [Nocardia sp. CDC159]